MEASRSKHNEKESFVRKISDHESQSGYVLPIIFIVSLIKKQEFLPEYSEKKGLTGEQMDTAVFICIPKVPFSYYLV